MAATVQHYVRRFRMEMDLADMQLPVATLPQHYEWIPWNGELTRRHAAVKYSSFCSEIDSHVFPSLGAADGCLRLMRDIAAQRTFLPDATWLIRFQGDDDFQLSASDCATIQSLRRPHAIGAIQNVGVHPTHRGMGLGRAVVLKAMEGFQRTGMRRVSLEVTAENEPAVRLYRSLGFQITRTMFQAINEMPTATLQAVC